MPCRKHLFHLAMPELYVSLSSVSHSSKVIKALLAQILKLVLKLALAPFNNLTRRKGQPLGEITIYPQSAVQELEI